MYLCHRGISEFFPENTIGSISEALEKEIYSGVEFDIQLTKDNKWIIYHDDTLFRLNGIDSNVIDLNYEEINKIDWKGNKFQVNLLSDLIYHKINSYRDRYLNIEIKNYLNKVPEKAIVNLFTIISQIKTKKFISSYDHNWFDICNKYNIDFACISNDVLPNKGNFWIMRYDLFDKIDLIDLIEKNIKLGCFGKTLKQSVDDISIPIDYQIVDDRSKKIVYINGLYDVLNSQHIEILEEAKKLGNYLVVGVFDNLTNNSFILSNYYRFPHQDGKDRAKLIENLKIVDRVIYPAPVNIDRKFIIDKSIDSIVHIGKIENWETHYQQAQKLNILKVLDCKSEDLISREVINNIFNTY